MTLFDDYLTGGLSLKNRIVMAPMTRCRTTQPGNIPNAMMADYYAQRAGAGLIITEATQISPQGQGYSFTPGIHTAKQIEGWRLVTDAVHQKGGKIFLQLWHVGRMSHESFHHGEPPVAPSSIKPDAQVWVADENGQGSMVDCPRPRALEIDEIGKIVEDYRKAAANAMKAGFDGVEIHAANGYLLDQFLRSTSNIRNDIYGGSIENRARLLLEVVEAVSDEVGASRVGVRLAPFITARGMHCPDIINTILYVAGEVDDLNVAYLHLSEADWDDAPQVSEGFRQQLRTRYKRSVIVAGKYDQIRATEIVNKGYADLVAFGRPFIANPDFPMRLQQGWRLAEFDSTTLFGGSEKGYVDYPNYSQ
ncbi:N-ethylmaleimide reductase [Grimontia celer]|uniref:N-ethylmaleimide reductase n=1 Tax=Grimontia celer TaxID=1796497 RepID=A0A128ESV2_9GAMM|nr:alkene reductase [Grimontia celer]CZF77652.1 N-ethylmaleimide reductase [Grimontia celer]